MSMYSLLILEVAALLLAPRTSVAGGTEAGGGFRIPPGTEAAGAGRTGGGA